MWIDAPERRAEPQARGYSSGPDRHAAIRALIALVALACGFLFARAEPVLSSTAWFTIACLA